MTAIIGLAVFAAVVSVLPIAWDWRHRVHTTLDGTYELRVGLLTITVDCLRRLSPKPATAPNVESGKRRY